MAMEGASSRNVGASCQRQNCPRQDQLAHPHSYYAPNFPVKFFRRLTGPHSSRG
jgi:hypothetical protein